MFYRSKVRDGGDSKHIGIALSPAPPTSYTHSMSRAVTAGRRRVRQDSSRRRFPSDPRPPRLRSPLSATPTIATVRVSINDPFNGPFNGPFNKTINDPSNEPINDPTNGPIKQPIKSPIDDPFIGSFNGLFNGLFASSR